MTDDEFKDLVITLLDNIQKKEAENQKRLKNIEFNLAFIAILVLIITALFVYGYYKLESS